MSAALEELGTHVELKRPDCVIAWDVTEGELKFRGRLSHFEIWKSEHYVEEVSAPIKDFLSDKPKNFNPLSMVP